MEFVLRLTMIPFALNKQLPFDAVVQHHMTQSGRDFEKKFKY
jgi:hypothetical protein